MHHFGAGFFIGGAINMAKTKSVRVAKQNKASIQMQAPVTEPPNLESLVLSVASQGESGSKGNSVWFRPEEEHEPVISVNGELSTAYRTTLVQFLRKAVGDLKQLEGKTLQALHDLLHTRSYVTKLLYFVGVYLHLWELPSGVSPNGTIKVSRIFSMPLVGISE